MSRRREASAEDGHNAKPATEPAVTLKPSRLPSYLHKTELESRWIQPKGESGRSWFHPYQFCKICWKSNSLPTKWVNVLWPFTIAALVLHFNYPQHQLGVFVTSYIGMIPAANLIGFAGQELARKMPRIPGLVVETTLGSTVELILFMVLIKGRDGNIPVIRAAILGSILANLLFCLGLCFVVGGIFKPELVFHEAISEVGSNLMMVCVSLQSCSTRPYRCLKSTIRQAFKNYIRPPHRTFARSHSTHTISQVAGMGLVIPTIFYNSLSLRQVATSATLAALDDSTTRISRATAIVLLVALFVYMYFQLRTDYATYDDILDQDEPREKEMPHMINKNKLTFTECKPTQENKHCATPLTILQASSP